VHGTEVFVRWQEIFVHACIICTWFGEIVYEQEIFVYGLDLLVNGLEGLVHGPEVFVLRVMIVFSRLQVFVHGMKLLLWYSYWPDGISA
jgi:hypothetical protein